MKGAVVVSIISWPADPVCMSKKQLMSGFHGENSLRLCWYHLSSQLNLTEHSEEEVI